MVYTVETTDKRGCIKRPVGRFKYVGIDIAIRLK